MQDGRCLQADRGWHEEGEQKWIIAGKASVLKAAGCVRQKTSLAQTRKVQTDGFKIPFLGVAETTVRLGSQSWWGLPRGPFGSFVAFLTLGRIA